MRYLNRLLVIAAVMIGTLFSSAQIAKASVQIMPDGNLFDAQFYMLNNPDVVLHYGSSAQDLYRHYLEYGKMEGRKPYADVVMDNTVITMKAFPRIGVIGDSYASGAIVKDGLLTDDYSVSWPQLMGKRNGVHVTNYTRGGFTTATWLMMPEGSFKMNNSLPDDLYILALGLNDSNVVGMMSGNTYLGSVADIKSGKIGSFYGNYARIIEQIKAHAPKAKLAMVYINMPAPITNQYNDAITEIAKYYGIPCINQLDDPFFSSSDYWNMEMGHPTKDGYSGMADAYARLITLCLNSNKGYFAPVK